MNKKRGRDAKPRRFKVPVTGTRRQRAEMSLRAINSITNSKATGEMVMKDMAPCGATSGVVFGVTGPQGGVSSNPAVSVAYWIRRKMKPLDYKPAIVTDASGKVIAKIEVDPVTGKKKRTVVGDAGFEPASQG